MIIVARLAPDPPAEGRARYLLPKPYTLRTVRYLFIVLLLLISPFALATQEIVAPRVRVLFDDAALESYAVRVAAEAEGALDALVLLFGFSPPPIVLRLEDTSDVYNALASPLPRPNVGSSSSFQPAATPLSSSQTLPVLLRADV